MIKGVQESGGQLNPSIVISITKAIYGSLNQSADLFENGGPILLLDSWARGVLARLDYVKRKATTTRKMTLEETTKAANDMKIIEEAMKNYHPSLVLEMDETMAPWCNSQDFTYAPRGSARIVIPGLGDKRGC